MKYIKLFEDFNNTLKYYTTIREVQEDLVYISDILFFDISTNIGKTGIKCILRTKIPDSRKSVREISIRIYPKVTDKTKYAFLVSNRYFNNFRDLLIEIIHQFEYYNSVEQLNTIIEKSPFLYDTIMNNFKLDCIPKEIRDKYGYLKNELF